MGLDRIGNVGCFGSGQDKIIMSAKNNQGDLFRGLGFRASGGLVWLLSYLCRVEVPCLARARGTFKNAKFGIIPRCRPKPKITIQ